VLRFPEIDPIAFQIGPLQVRWYGLMYVFGFVGGYFLVRWLAKKKQIDLPKDVLQELISYLVVGVIVGGRLGYVLFYNLPFYLANPLEIFAVWRGGMSFHGGLIGASLMGWWFTKKHGLSFYRLADLCVVAVPIGLGLGRIGNFINGELYGRPTNVPWAVVFPQGGPVPRHPSQLYEAFLEGVVLFAVLLWLSERVQTEGVMFWTFVGGYGLARFVVEFFREPDPQLGFVVGPFSMGQILSLAMILTAALFLLLRRSADSLG
jgi:phosphatidylglycerol---prolipoprotein diacylglyceryl transferase